MQSVACRRRRSYGPAFGHARRRSRARRHRSSAPRSPLVGVERTRLIFPALRNKSCGRCAPRSPFARQVQPLGQCDRSGRDPVRIMSYLLRMDDLIKLADDMERLLLFVPDTNGLIPPEKRASFSALAVEAKSILQEELGILNNFSWSLGTAQIRVNGHRPSYALIDEAAKIVRAAIREVAANGLVPKPQPANSKPHVDQKSYVDHTRIVALQAINHKDWDFYKLAELCREINVAAANRIQSIYEGFGSGVPMGDTGIALHNRGAGFAERGGPPQPDRSRASARSTRSSPGCSCATAGCPGTFGDHGRGSMQAQAHFQLVRHVVDDGLDPQAALDAARFRVVRRAPRRGRAGARRAAADGAARARPRRARRGRAPRLRGGPDDPRPTTRRSSAGLPTVAPTGTPPGCARARADRARAQPGAARPPAAARAGRRSLPRPWSGWAGSRPSTRRRCTSGCGRGCEGFERATLTRALERRSVVQGDADAVDDPPRVARRLVAARAAVREARASGGCGHRGRPRPREMAAPRAAPAPPLADGPMTPRGDRRAARQARGGARRRHVARHGARAAVGHVGAPPRRPLRGSRRSGSGPAEATPRGRGAAGAPLPGRLRPGLAQEIANWAGLPAARSRRRSSAWSCAASATRTGASCSTSRARRCRTPRRRRPCASCPTWDATLLVHARRTRDPARGAPAAGLQHQDAAVGRRRSSSTARSPAHGATRRGGSGSSRSGASTARRDGRCARRPSAWPHSTPEVARSQSRCA